MMRWKQTTTSLYVASYRAIEKIRGDFTWEQGAGGSNPLAPIFYSVIPIPGDAKM
jgi:hypothetical protein